MDTITLETVQTNISQLQKSLDDSIRCVLKNIHSASNRVVIFIDHTNLHHSFRRNDNSNLRLDYVKLVDYLRAFRSLRQVRIYYSEFDEPGSSAEERIEWSRRQDFYAFLRYQGYFLRQVRRREYDGQSVEKGLDVALARDMLALCKGGYCDTAVLVSGDADYCEVVEEAQCDCAVRVEVAFFRLQASRDLQLKATQFIDLLEVKDRLLRKPTRSDDSED